MQGYRSLEDKSSLNSSCCCKDLCSDLLKFPQFPRKNYEGISVVATCEEIMKIQGRVRQIE